MFKRYFLILHILKKTILNYIDLILPIPLQRLFTYEITEAEADFIMPGMRVAVPFGKSKIYTGIVARIHQDAPTAYEAKPIFQILDEQPIVNEKQLKHWQWIATYYMCTVGEVLRSAIPSIYLLESETKIIKNPSYTIETALTNDEFLIVEALAHQEELPIQKISEILDKKTVLPIVQSLMSKGALTVKEEIIEQYTPKLTKYIRLSEHYEQDAALETLLTALSRAPQQSQLVLLYFSIKATTQKPISYKALKTQANVSDAVITALVKKEIFEVYTLETDRVDFGKAVLDLKELSDAQQRGYEAIQEQFQDKSVVLLHGITSSGKTEIYVKFIQEIIDRGEQVLYLVPEIALTTQLIQRLKQYFGNQIAVFHSKYSLNERVEVWRETLSNSSKAKLILGARSSVLLPFENLGLIIVDEEHETSYKQFDPAPRYHARDAAIVLAQMHSAKVILGSATPSIESYFNAKADKYGLVELKTRFGNVLLPEVELVDIKEGYRKKRMKGHFSERLRVLITEALEAKEQVILFQNRRGFSPIVECMSCGVSPHCPNCDVSLTYHKFKNQLQCHYCGYHRDLPKVCGACGTPNLDTKGFGTEQVELELGELFPEAKIGRMDLDTTRGKHGYQKIISAFQGREIDILVGTQMLTKGLDFDNVTVVGVLNADNMLNFPDFRAHERSFQLLVQVAGRAGRADKRGKVAIQTFNPYHQILQQVSTNDYQTMYQEQLNDRYQFQYPPIQRLLKITLKHKDFNKVNTGANWLATSLVNNFGNLVLGPTSPAVSRIRNQHIKTILVKLPKNIPVSQSKNVLQKIKNSFQAVAEFRAIRFNIDVDNY